jgi:quercetin dioxygenase-like cupin family protein
MRLPKPFYRLPLAVDAARLAGEVAALPATAWAAHPQGYAGNTAVRLISAHGREDDGIAGAMAPTPHLARCPYIRQVLARFQTVFGRSRLMRLAAGAEVPQHADINYHWHTRVRIHIPVVTNPAVEFWCEEEKVHMAAGEVWIFDNWRQHRVLNGGSEDRIHVVADTAGSSEFWDLAFAEPPGPARAIPFEPGAEPPLATERFTTPTVMAPGELQWLIDDLLRDLEANPEASREALARFRRALARFTSDWRQVWYLHADQPQALPTYDRLRRRLVEELATLREPLSLASNGVPAGAVLRARVLAACLTPPGEAR